MALLLPLALCASTAFGETPRGSYFYANRTQCIDDKKLDGTLCANAAANAEAEFDEKAPRFPTRHACEAAFGAGRCELGLAGTSGWSGEKRGVYFTPRQAGFRVTVRSQSDMTVLPSMSGRELGFAPRSILKLETSRSARFRREPGLAWAKRGGAGRAEPEGPAGPLPPPPVVDPGFDCSALLEPSAGQSAASGCFPVPAGRMRR
jgi:uncharacterized protein YgiB involved in biofilm formation